MNTPKESGTSNGEAEQSIEHLLSKRLLIGACALWLISLALPAFVVSGKIEPVLGFSAMLGGLIFGWWVFGWAAYANVFFVYVAVRLSRRESSPKATLCMVILALTLFGFRGVITSEASGVPTPVVSWGWGAVIWFFSMGLLALASLSNGTIGRLTIWLGIGSISLVVLATAALGISQKTRANLQESEMYLSSGTAFTTAPISGIPLTWPESALVPIGEMVAFDVEDSLTNPVDGAPLLWLPPAKVIRQYGFYWTVFNSGQGNELKVKLLGAPPRFLLTAKATTDGAIIQLIDVKANQILYEQKLISRILSRGNREFLPRGHSWLGGRYGVVPALNTALRIDPGNYPNPHVIGAESARSPCNIRTAPGGSPFLATWVGKDIQVKPSFDKSGTGFCSTNYVVFVQIRGPVSGSTENRSAMVHLFDRKTLEPIARFFNKSKCATTCPSDDSIEVTGVRISDNAVVVESELGEIVASLRSN